MKTLIILTSVVLPLISATTRAADTLGNPINPNAVAVDGAGNVRASSANNFRLTIASDANGGGVASISTPSPSSTEGTSLYLASPCDSAPNRITLGITVADESAKGYGTVPAVGHWLYQGGRVWQMITHQPPGKDESAPKTTLRGNVVIEKTTTNDGTLTVDGGIRTGSFKFDAQGLRVSDVTLIDANGNLAGGLSKGIQGPQGVQGPPGIQGPQGIQGPPGPVGLVTLDPGIESLRKHGGLDGADITGPLREAISAARQSRQPGAKVLIEPGSYIVTDTISLSGVTIQGIGGESWSADGQVMPVLNFKLSGSSSPGLVLRAGAGMHGIECRFDQTKDMTGAAVEVDGVGVNISNVKLVSPYNGIVSTGGNVGRLSISDTFIVSVGNHGIRLSKAFDAVYISRVHVWSPNRIAAAGMVLGHLDQIHVSDVFVFQAKVGILLQKDADDGGTAWGTFSGVAADFCTEGLKILDCGAVTFHGANFWCHQRSVSIAGGGRVVLSACDLKSNAGENLLIKGATVAVNGCTFVKSGATWRGVPKISVNSRSALVTVTGCTFDGTSKGVELIAAKGIVVQGNVFELGITAIDDKSGPTTRKLLTNNL